MSKFVLYFVIGQPKKKILNAENKIQKGRFGF